MGWIVRVRREGTRRQRTCMRSRPCPFCAGMSGRRVFILPSLYVKRVYCDKKSYPDNVDKHRKCSIQDRDNQRGAPAFRDDKPPDSARFSACLEPARRPHARRRYPVSTSAVTPPPFRRFPDLFPRRKSVGPRWVFELRRDAPRVSSIGSIDPGGTESRKPFTCRGMS